MTGTYKHCAVTATLDRDNTLRLQTGYLDFESKDGAKIESFERQKIASGVVRGSGCSVEDFVFLACRYNCCAIFEACSENMANIWDRESDWPWLVLGCRATWASSSCQRSTMRAVNSGQFCATRNRQ